MFYAGGRPMGRPFYLAGVLLVLAGGLRAARPGAHPPQGGPTTTTVSDTVFRADGTPAQGNLVISWPAFVTASGTAVAGGTTNVALGTGGALSVALVPNAGATPAGAYYVVVYQLGPGEVRTEDWVVPTTSPANLATVRTVPGSGVAAQPVSQQYVNTALAGKANDNAVVHLSGSETISGSKSFSIAPTVPTPTSTGQAANKAYVDTSVGTVGAGSFLSIAGGTMTGPITLPSNPVAPLQATTKQYVDTEFAVKADLITGLVPPSELGSGTANSTTCLLGNGTWGTCAAGGSGSGNVSTSPSANQSIIQPAGTQFGADNLDGIRYVSLAGSAFNWSAIVTGTNLTGAVTANLSPCPKGIFGSDNTTTISINNGAEYVLLQGGGTCIPGSAGTITFTLIGTYTNPVLSSASSGIQEALIDAQSSGTGTKKSNYRVVFQPTNPPNTSFYAINAAVTIPNGVTDLDFSGASIDCEADDACFKITSGTWDVVVHGARVGTKTTRAGGAITHTACSSNVTTITTSSTPPSPTLNKPIWVDIQNTDSTHYWGIHPVLGVNSGVSFTMTDNNCAWATSPGSGSIASLATPGGWGLEHAFIEDSGTNTRLQDLYLDTPAWTTGKLNNFLVILNDQASTMDNIVTGGNGVQCDANYCGQVIYNPGPFSGAIQAPAIGRVTRSQISLQCQGNGINWLGGNGLRVSDNTVIQGYQQFSLQTGTIRGGFAETFIDSLYNEVGNCSNPVWTAAGFTGLAARNMAGVSVLGGFLDVLGGAVGGRAAFRQWRVDYLRILAGDLRRKQLLSSDALRAGGTLKQRCVHDWLATLRVSDRKHRHLQRLEDQRIGVWTNSPLRNWELVAYHYGNCAVHRLGVHHDGQHQHRVEELCSFECSDPGAIHVELAGIHRAEWWGDDGRERPSHYKFLVGCDYAAKRSQRFCATLRRPDTGGLCQLPGGRVVGKQQCAGGRDPAAKWAEQWGADREPEGQTEHYCRAFPKLE
jgi:hypothetical protein